MTPQEKAKELYSKYLSIIGYSGTVDIFYPQKIEAIKCSLMAVDEIIKELTEEISPSIHGFRHDYWEEVKNEIAKL